MSRYEIEDIAWTFALWCKSHGYTMNDVNSTLVNNYMWDNDLHGGQIYNALMIVTF